MPPGTPMSLAMYQPRLFFGWVRVLRDVGLDLGEFVKEELEGERSVLKGEGWDVDALMEVVGLQADEGVVESTSGCLKCERCGRAGVVIRRGGKGGCVDQKAPRTLLPHLWEDRMEAVRYSASHHLVASPRGAGGRCAEGARAATRRRRGRGEGRVRRLEPRRAGDERVDRAVVEVRADRERRRGEGGAHEARRAQLCLARWCKVGQCAPFGLRRSPEAKALLQMVQGGRWDAVLRQGGRHFRPAGERSS